MKPAADPHNSILINSVGNLYSDLSLADFIAISENSSRSAASFSQKAQSEGDEATDDQLRQVWRV